MVPKFKRIALAISAGAFLLAAPLAQAASSNNPIDLKKADKFNEKLDNVVFGGSLYVSDPSQNVVFSLVFDDDLYYPTHQVLYRDGLDGEWKSLFYDDSYQYINKHPNTSFSLDIKSDQVFFAITVDLKRGASAEKGLYQFSTGDGSLDTTTAASKALLGTPHSAVVYDYKGQSNVAVIGFEDTPRFHLSDYDDFIFTVSNVQQFENPLSPPLPSVPEPETYAMLLAGLGIIGAVARRRRMSGM